MNIGRPLRIAAAIALAIGGLVHLQLYFEGYRSIDKIGPSFLLNAIASAMVAVALVSRREWLVRLAGLGVALGTIAAFIISRQGDGLFNYRERGFDPSPQATIALIVEIAAVVLLLVSFMPSITDDGESASIGLLGASAVVGAAAFVGLGTYWSSHYDGTQMATKGGIQISNFAFGPPSLSVTAGTTVTWTNEDSFDHSIVATDVSFHSDNIGHDQTYSFRFDKPGQFAYVCGIHPQMNGTITVTG